MSKEPTSKGRHDSSNDDSGRRRRRRRGGGLRVPSDKVPRATTNREAEIAEPPEPPEPEAPEVAVSVADAFGGEGAGGVRRPSESADRSEGAADGGDADGGAAVSAPESEGEGDEPGGGGAHDASDEPAAAAGAEEGDGAGGGDSGDGDADGPEAGEDEAGDGEVESALARADSVDIPIEEEPQEPQQRRPRAKTEALTEEDLEELMEPIEDEEEGAEAGDSAPAEDEVDFDAEETAQFVPVVIEESEEEPAKEERRREEEPADSRVPTAVAILERRGIGESSAAATRDAGDSGELLSDELVQEIDDPGAGSGREAEAEAGTEPGGASLLDTGEYQELDEDEEDGGQEEGAKAPDPPPVPDDTAAAKPPPAPGSGPSFVQQAQKGRPGAYGKAWFDEIFDEDYLRTLPFLTPQATQAEARFVADAIAASPGAQLLDLGCGYGRHAMELAARGYHVVGLDSSLPLLLRGADEAQRRGLTINFVHGDMRELTFESQFDAAYCLFSTFGYFDDEANKNTAQNIARALKPGARFVVEVLNRDYLIQDLPARVWWEGDGCVVLEEVDFNYFSSRIVSNRSVVFDDGRQLEQEISIRAYSLHELGKLLHAAGFRVLEVSGSMNTRGRFFGAKARDIIVVAEKRGG